MPDDVLTRPQTIERALWEFDLNAFPTLRHIQTGTDSILPLLKDGTKKNPERMNILRQRSDERERVMQKVWNDDERAMFASQIPEQREDARITFARGHGYEKEMKMLVHLNEAYNKYQHALRNKGTDAKEIKEGIDALKKVIRDSLRSKGYEGPSISPQGESKNSQGGKKKKTRRRKQTKRKLRKRKRKRKRKTRKKK